MATSFSRTLRSLRADGSRTQLTVVFVALALLAVWGTWMVRARVTVYEATSSARIEVEQASHPVQAPVSGRVTVIAMPLGRRVAVGDLLCELDSAAERLELERARARLLAIGPELEALRRELLAHTQASAEDSQGIAATVAEERAKHDESSVAVRLAEEQLARAEKLRAEGLASDADLARAQAELAQKRAASAAQLAAIGRTGASGKADLSDRRAQTQALARQAAILEGEQLTTKAQIDRLDHDVTLRVIRASIEGRLAEVAPITVGSVVQEGTRLGAIVPDGTLRIVGEFPPPSALGRIRPGQSARMRLDGFPWAQHGTIPARVTHVASEVRVGRVRVELEVLPNDSDVPLQHGLPGSIEVEIERATPFELVLRAAGKIVEGRGDPPEVTGPAAPPVSPGEVP